MKHNIGVIRAEAEALIIDCTEQPIQRPSRKQRCWYSGKKKRPHNQDRDHCHRTRQVR